MRHSIPPWEKSAIRLVTRLIVGTLMVSLGATWNGAQADPMADCARFSAVQAWEATVTLRGDGEGSPKRHVTMSYHETITAPFTLELVKPSSSLPK